MTKLALLAWSLGLAAELLLPTWTRPGDPGDGRVRYTARLAVAC
jgi:hypothetical protein